ncbi:hypothetical protein [uncultured Erythrobacter sp.]|uniref:hypothetical protein n=1 Tax=uncultured Erythrobacter sp. TaxID=263913 RepID=UPI002613C4D5|nr:hypothetical protein [uncultured Erythrobacter sp.]
MTRITNSDQVIAAIRAQLQRMAKRTKADATSKTAKPEAKSMSTRQMVDALAAIEGLSEEDFTRGFVRALLTEEFGESLANSPGFQSVIDRTANSIASDREVRAMLDNLRRGKA